MKILYIIPSYNIYGGTPKKTLDLLQSFKKDSALYVYNNSYREFRNLFQESEALIYEGYYGRNIYLHIKKLLEIIDKCNIDIIQTQFTTGEILGAILKRLRPKLKLIITFESSLQPYIIKKYLVSICYKYVDTFVYISKYVEKEKRQQFSILKNKPSKIIYNGSNKRVAIKENEFEILYPSLVDIAGLIKIKNISILINAIDIIQTETGKNIHLYIVGDGPERLTLEAEIKQKKLTEFVHLLGYQENVGELLEKSDIFVHPCYMEGFGISVVEA
ncbi:glycosyltransferase, partial [Methanocaldococcus sp.]